MPGNPLIWLAVLGWLSAAGTYGVMKVQELRKWQLAYDQGVVAGKGLGVNQHGGVSNRNGRSRARGNGCHAAAG